MDSDKNLLSVVANVVDISEGVLEFWTGFDDVVEGDLSGGVVVIAESVLPESDTGGDSFPEADPIELE